MSRIVTHVANFADKSAQVAIQGTGNSAEAAIADAVKHTDHGADQFVAEECTERMGAYLETKSLSRWRTVKVDGRSLVDLYDEDAEWSFVVHVNMRAHVPVKISANSLAEAHAEIEKLLAGKNGTEVLVDIAVDQCLADDGVVLDSVESLDLANAPRSASSARPTARSSAWPKSRPARRSRTARPPRSWST